VTGFGGVFAVVLAELVAGGLTLTWLSPLWHEAKRSYFTIYGAIATLLFALPAWLVAAAASDGSPNATWAVRCTFLTFVLLGLSTLGMVLRWQSAARVAGLLSVPASIAVLGVLAALGDRSYAASLALVLAGAAFLGAAYDCLFLGHWYLTDRKLTRTPIARYTTILIVASVVQIVVVAITGSSGGTVSRSLNPILAVGDVAPWIGIGMAAATLLIAVMAKAALRGERASAVQSATGFFYLGVITALTAEIAVTTRFFPG
jgi:hypothetical protein